MEYEYKLIIGGVTYGMADLSSVGYQHPLFDSFSVGNTCAAELVAKYYADTPPSRMATIVAYYSVKDSGVWSALGTIFVDTRSQSAGLYTLYCYDAMLKSDLPYDSLGEITDWPKTYSEVVTYIAGKMGIEVDSRTVLRNETAVAYPNDESMRTVLGWIAAAHGGNWTVTNDNKLLLVPLFSSMPSETFYLIAEDGNSITFGEGRILV